MIEPVKMVHYKTVGILGEDGGLHPLFRESGKALRELGNVDQNDWISVNR